MSIGPQRIKKKKESISINIMASMQTKTQPKEGFGQKVRRATEVAGTIKGIWDTGRALLSAGQAAAPYVRAGLALL